MGENKIPLLHYSGPFPDLISPIQFLYHPEALFDTARKLNSEIFCFRLIREPWIFLTGNEGLQFYSKLTIDEVDPFEFRKKMFTIQLPVKMPTDLANATLATNRILREFFEKIKEDEFTEIFVHEANRYINSNLTEEGTIDNFFKFMIELSTQTIGISFLGRELFDKLPKDLGNVYNDIDELLTIGALLFPFFPRKNRKMEAQLKKKVAVYLSNLITEREKNATISSHSNLLDGYINLQSQLGLSQDNIIWLFNAMLWSAIHYSSVHGIWTGIEILKRQNLLTDLLEEQAQFKDLNFEAVKKMYILQGTIREGIRLNSIFALPRRVLKDLNFKGYRIPKGAIISISPFYEHHNPEVYVNPNTFDPFRWDEWADAALYDSFIPGGIGTFSCKGMPFAIHYLTVFWAILLRTYQLELVNAPPVMNKQLVLIAPPTHVPMRYKKL